MREGGSKAVWNFPENSSDLVAWPVPYTSSYLHPNELTWVWCDAVEMISQALATYCTSTCEQQNNKNRWSFRRKDMQFTYSSHPPCQCQRAADRSWVTRSWRRRTPCPPPPPAWQCPCSRLASLETPWQGTPSRKPQCSGTGSINMS